MITMKPVILHGRTVWDQGYFPRDEGDERLKNLQAEMARRGLGGLIVFGDGVEYGDLCYLTQFTPMTTTQGMAVVPVEGGVTLIPSVFGGGRDIPAARARSCVDDVRALRSLGPGLRELVADRGITGKVGLAGLERLSSDAYDQVTAAFADLECTAADELMNDIRGSLRPREVSAVREATRIVKAAADAAVAAHSSGAGNAAAVAEADGAARRLGAHDFRGLAVLGEDGELAAVEMLDSFRSEPFVAYFAVSFLGYWAELGVTVGGPRTALLDDAERGLSAMIGGVRAGVKAGAVVQRASETLGPAAAGRALRYGLGNGIGLSLQASPMLSPDSEDTLVEGSVLALRVRLDGSTGPGALVSDLVLVKEDGCESLLGT